MLNASYQVDYANWETLRKCVQEAFGVDLQTPDDNFGFEELFCVLREEHGLDPCRYQRGDLLRVHAHRATNWWSEHEDICVAAARAALSWYLSQFGNDRHPIYGKQN